MQWQIIAGGVVVLLVLVSVVLTRVSNKRAETKKNAGINLTLKQWRDLLDQAKAGNTDAQEELIRGYHRNKWGPLYKYDNNLNQQLVEFGRQLAGRKETERVLSAFREKLGNYHSANSAVDRAETATRLLELWDPQFDATFRAFEKEAGFDRGQLRAKLLAHVCEYAQELIAVAETDAEAFRKLKVLRFDCSSDPGLSLGRFRKQDVKATDWLPDNWNDLVAIHVANPSIWDFESLQHRRDIPVGTVRKMSADALRDGNFTAAKIALAYCNASDKIRLEVGDVLTADLARLIASHTNLPSVEQSGG